MKKIPLVNNRGFTTVDEDVYEWAHRYKWYLDGKGRVSRAVYVGTGRKDDRRKRFYLHRLIIGASKGRFVDHIDGDPTNNVRSNLRLCNNAQNCRNKKIAKNNTSGYKGVSKNKHDGKWWASITTDWKRVHLGRFPTKHLAAEAYNRAAIEKHGEFARLNEIQA